MSKIVVVDYDPGWPRLFDRLRWTIWPAVEEIAIAMEHVGSTAVPGLAAKPVIDIDLVVPESEIPAAIARLTSLGYEHRGNLGIAQREAFQQPAGSPPHHLYLCPPAGPALANHLAIRDYLRANPQDAHAYGELKKRLARECAGDRDCYVAGKTNFIVRILDRIGFSVEVLADIERTNRLGR